MKLRITCGLGALTLASAVVCFSPQAWADGNQAHGSSYVQRSQGLRAMGFGVGLSGRRAGLDAEPVAKAAIEVAGLPKGAIVEQAYLYWVTYGETGSPTLEVDGEPVTGTAIGSSSGTCWTAYPTFKNFTYRADVTDLVTGNDTFELSNFPSATAKADTQGASLFVVYTDPTDEASGTVLLYDGAITSSDMFSFSSTFEDIRPPAEVLSADLLFSVGDGELVIPDGPLSFDTAQLPWFGQQYWSSSAGMYWDVRRFDVAALVNAGDDTIKWSATFGGDCLVFAYSALAFRSEHVDGTGGAGNSSGGADNASGGAGNAPGGAGNTPGGAGNTPGGADNGSGGDGNTPRGGTSATGHGGAGTEAGASAEPEGGDGSTGYAASGDDAGCGCRLAPDGSSRLSPLLWPTVLLGWLLRKRHRAAVERRVGAG